jgi:NADH-quinone oxidoreductase subunit E
MLSDAERKELEALLREYPHRRAGYVEALLTLQRHRGWVSDEGLEGLAGILGASPAELEGLATFYNCILRRPVGRHLLWLCDSASCWILGCDRLREALRDRLGVEPGETTADGRFTLLPTVCLGACDRAPVLAVDDTLHPDASPHRLEEILASYD